MRLLLDTHALIWTLNDSPELSSRVHAAIADSQYEKWLSVASLWEITIKVNLGKLPLVSPLADFLKQLENNPIIRQLPIETHHLLQLVALPFHHRDPFDRLIVAQALSGGCTLVSRDEQLDA